MIIVCARILNGCENDSFVVQWKSFSFVSEFFSLKIGNPVVSEWDFVLKTYDDDDDDASNCSQWYAGWVNFVTIGCRFLGF